MSTTKQKTAAKKNIAKARTSRSGTSRGGALSTAEKNDLPASKFAFAEQRKEPLVDAKHVRNAVARFDQVEGLATRIGIRRGSGSGPRRGSRRGADD